MGYGSLLEGAALGAAIQGVGLVLSLIGIALSLPATWSASDRKRARPALKWYIAGTGFAAVAVFASFYWHFDLAPGCESRSLLQLWTYSLAWQRDPTMVWFVWFVLMLAFANLPRLLPKGGGKSSPTWVFDFSAVLLFGPAGACVLAGATSVLSNFGRPFRRLLFNFFQIVLSVSATALVFRLGGTFGEGLRIDSLASLLSLVLAALTYFFVNSLLVARAIAWSEDISFDHAWRRNFLLQVQDVLLVLLPVGTLLALAQTRLGYPGLLLALPIVILAHLAYEGRLTRAAIQRTVLRIVAFETDRAQDGATNHSLRLAAYSVRVAWEMGATAKEARDLEFAALLHNFTGLALRGVLAKEGPLENEDRVEVELHPKMARDVLQELPGLDDAAWILYRHHERPDGKGYPAGVREDTPLAARILMAVDAFDAMIHDRPHSFAKRASEEAYQELRIHSGTQFCPHVVETVIRLHKLGRLDEEFDRAFDDLSILRSAKYVVGARQNRGSGVTGKPEPSSPQTGLPGHGPKRHDRRARPPSGDDEQPTTGSTPHDV